MDADAERTQSKIYFKAAAHLEHPESLHLGVHPDLTGHLDMHPDLTGRHKEKDKVYYYVLRITAMSSAPRVRDAIKNLIVAVFVLALLARETTLSQ